MDKETYFWYIIGIFGVNILLTVGLIISFSFGVINDPYDETTKLNILLQSGEVDCSNINYYGVRYSLPSGETFQCGYQLSTTMISYIIIIIIFILQIIALILYTLRAGNLTTIAFVILLVVPVGMLVTLIVQGRDITKGLEICQTFTDMYHEAKCRAFVFIIPVIITAIEIVASIVLEAFIVYGRGCKHHSNPEHSHKRTRKIKPDDYNDSSDEEKNKKKKNKRRDNKQNSDFDFS